MAIDKLVDSSALDANLTTVANAIRTKGGTSAQLSFPSGMAQAINDIQTGITPTGTTSITENGTYDVTNYAGASVNVPTGGGGEVEHGVNFIDYDGTIVDSWESASVASKSALPNNPAHTGLVAQGWNWSLADIKSYIASYPNAVVIVGQMYATSSGLTEIDITLTNKTGLSVDCNMIGNKNWGDGSSDSLTSHTYADYGNYTITCDGTSVPNGTSSVGGLLGNSSASCTSIRVGGNVTILGEYAFAQCNVLKSVTMPNSITGSLKGTFYYCKSLESVTIPDGITILKASVFYWCFSIIYLSIPDSITTLNANELFSYCRNLLYVTIPRLASIIPYRMCYYCMNLKSITITNSVTSIDSYAFYECHALKSATISNSVSSISTYAFYDCYALRHVNIPDGVQSIQEYSFAYTNIKSITIPSSVRYLNNSCFNNCQTITEYDFSASQSVPSLSHTNALTGINDICKIVVPDALYQSWIAKTNWSTYANYIYKASEVA